VSNEGLAHVWCARVKLFVKLRLVQIVSAWDGIDVNNLSIDRSMPMMIGQCTQKSLKYSSSNKHTSITFLVSILSEHVDKRVKISF